YSISLTEPYFLDSDYSLTLAGFYRDREFEEYDETRFGGRVRLGRRFGDRWSAGLNLRAENVELSDFDSDAPVDYLEAEGPDTLIGVGVSAIRTTVPPAERLYPSRGARTELGVEQVMGDYSFTKLSLDHEFWIGVYEDYLGRRSVFSMRVAANWIPQEGEAPVYERYYLGGRSFRGFDFRGVSPRGIRSDTGEVGNDPVGGDWSFFAGAEFRQPIWGVTDGRPIIAGVAFVDTGTVLEEIGFDDYRLSVGLGLRMLLPISPAPLAFDFGFPLIQEDEDDTQLFSFSIDIPF
ncbi:MAG: outer membrane protein assembly factor, partial [Planctomycetota bacterium]|nr:outer membrane protein assembly factor [Planctomycetota bacterium]